MKQMNHLRTFLMGLDETEAPHNSHFFAENHDKIYDLLSDIEAFLKLLKSLLLQNFGSHGFIDVSRISEFMKNALEIDFKTTVKEEPMDNDWEENYYDDSAYLDEHSIPNDSLTNEMLQIEWKENEDKLTDNFLSNESAIKQEAILKEEPEDDYSQGSFLNIDINKKPSLKKTFKLKKEKNPSDKYCEFCDLTYDFIEDIASHILKHKQSRILNRCPRRNVVISCSLGECPQKFENFLRLKKHVHKTHKGHKACPFCFAIMTDLEIVEHVEEIHLVDKNATKIPKCERCDKKFRTIPKWEQHQKICSMKIDSIMACKYCGLVYTQENKFYDHVKRHETLGITEVIPKDEPTKCSLCNIKFESFWQLKEHVTMAHEPQHEICHLCHKVTPELRQHVAFHFGKVDKKVCTECGEMYNPKDMHGCKAEWAKVECDVCGKIYMNSKAMLAHKRNIHGQRKEFPCEICGKIFLKKDKLERHINDIHNENRTIFACKECSHTSSQKFNVVNHIMRRHTNWNKAEALTLVFETSRE